MSAVYLESLAHLIQQHHAEGAYGVLLLGLPDPPVKALAECLGGPAKVAVSLIGLPNADEVVRWARKQDWDETHFGADADATHAVDVRNRGDLPKDVIRLAVAQEEVARLHSLQEGWYRRIGTDEVEQQVARIGAGHAVNQPQTHLWEALATEEVASYLSLEDLIRYYDTVLEETDENDIEAARRQLPLLHLLRDPELFNDSQGVKQRLLRNAHMVERLQQPSRKEEDRAARNARNQPVLQKAYHAFERLRRGDLDALSDLTFPQAERLFGRPEPPASSKVSEPTDEDEGAPSDEPPSFDHPADAAVELTAQGNSDALDDLVRGALNQFSKDKLKKEQVETDRASTDFEPDSRAQFFTQRFVSEDHFGGVLRTTQTLDDLLTSDKPGYDLDDEDFRSFGDVRLQELRRYMERAQKLDPEFRGLRLLDRYLTKRAALTQPAARNEIPSDGDPYDEATSSAALTHADVLAHDQLALTYLVARPDVLAAVRAATDAYQRLLSHLEDRFYVLQDSSPQGAARLYSEVLALDLIVIHAKDEMGALLSPLSPLVLWKHRVVADLVRDERRTLDASDRTLLREAAREMPEPLLALYAPSTEGEDGTELIHAGRVGSLPLYRPSTVEVADVGAGSLQRAAEKLAALYPPVRKNLRVLLLNPRSLAPAAEAAKKLLTVKSGFEHVSLLVSTPENREASKRSMPSLGTALDEAHAQGNVTLETIPAAGLDDLVKHLRHRPAHILAVAGEQQRAGGVVRRETTRLHPLSVPRRLEADGITGELSLQPRSNRPPDDQPHHPYGLYQSVVSSLTRKQHRDHTLREHQRISLSEHAPLLRCASFYVMAGVPKEGAGQDGALRLAQGGGTHGDTVFTGFESRIMRGVTSLLKQDNYSPTEEGIRTLLRRIEEVGGEGLFSAITDKELSGFSESALKGHIALAVALGWYEAQAAEEDYLVLSLDSPLARRWLGQREDGRRADLLGFRRTPDGMLAVDVIEIKGYAASGETRVTTSQAAQQLRATRHVLHDIFHQPGDLLTDCRRELLRLQVYREGLLSRPDVDREWVRELNDLIDGETNAAPNQLVDQLLIEVHLKENKPFRDERFDTEESGTLRRVQLAEADVQQHLSGVIAPPGQPASSNGRAPVDSSSSGENAEPDSAKDAMQQTPSASAPSSATTEDAQEDTETSGEPERATQAPQPIETEENATESNQPSFAPSAQERERLAEQAKGVYKALEDHRINLAGAVDPDLADVGPNIVRYKVRLQAGERLARVQSAAPDLMRELAIRQEPIVGNLPGTSFVHVDVPRQERKTALLRPVLERATDGERERSPYSVPAGIEPGGATEWLPIPELPHMLVAGATGSGKSVFLRSLIVSLSYLHPPEALQLVLVDPKRTDFGLFRQLPHLRAPGVITDPEAAIDVLDQLVTSEMERRTQVLEENLYLDIHAYNEDYPDARIPPIVVVIDEFADLSDVMETSEQRDAFDHALRRLAQRARSVGIHLVLATQRPTTDVVNGTIKANLPCRVSFRLESNVDSRTVLDQGGAEHLLDNGDMLLRRGGQATRLQGLFLDQKDLRDVLQEIIQRHETQHSEA